MGVHINQREVVLHGMILISRGTILRTDGVEVFIRMIPKHHQALTHLIQKHSMEPELLQKLLELGGLAAMFAFAIREYFAYQKNKDNKKNGGGDVFGGAIFKELQIMNSNHLHSIEEAINKGNCRLVDIIHQDNIKIIEVLSEIKGHLQK